MSVTTERQDDLYRWIFSNRQPLRVLYIYCIRRCTIHILFWIHIQLQMQRICGM